MGQKFNTQLAEYDLNGLTITQVFIFKGEECLGWDCFFRDSISVGSDPHADIYLDDANVADIHAMIYFKRGQILVSTKSPENHIAVNGKTVGSCILRSLDFISIGPYTLKIKAPRFPSTSDRTEVGSKTRIVDSYKTEVTRISKTETPWEDWIEEDPKTEITETHLFEMDHLENQTLLSKHPETDDPVPIIVPIMEGSHDESEIIDLLDPIPISEAENLMEEETDLDPFLPTI